MHKKSNALVELTLNQRFKGWCLDGLILIIPMMIISLIIGSILETTFPNASFADLKELNKGISFLIIYALYFGLYEPSRGASIGLRKCGGEIVTTTGETAPFGLLVKRYFMLNPSILLLPFIFIPKISGISVTIIEITGLYWALSFIFMISRSDNRYPIDLLLDTTVIDISKTNFKNKEIESEKIEIAKTIEPIDPISPIKNRIFALELSNEKVNAIYAQVAEEISKSKYHQGLIARAKVESNGNPEEEQRIYISLRVQQYIDDHKAKDTEEQKLTNEKNKQEYIQNEKDKLAKHNDTILNSVESKQKLTHFIDSLNKLTNLRKQIRPLYLLIIYFVFIFIMFSSPLNNKEMAREIDNIIMVTLGTSIWIVTPWLLFTSLKRRRQNSEILKTLSENNMHVELMSKLGHLKAIEALAIYKKYV